MLRVWSHAVNAEYDFIETDNSNSRATTTKTASGTPIRNTPAQLKSALPTP